MNTKTLLSLAIIAVLPLTTMAENISGAMYVAPAAADNDHPAPTTQAGTLYGRIDIDTADQEHIATTAYVKGAYNSAIAAVNTVSADFTDAVSDVANTVVNQFNRDIDDLYNEIHNEIENVNSTFDYVQDKLTLASNNAPVSEIVIDKGDFSYQIRNGYIELQISNDTNLVTAGAVADVFASQRVNIYTTWDTNDTTPVQLSFVPYEQ